VCEAEGFYGIPAKLTVIKPYVILVVCLETVQTSVPTIDFTPKALERVSIILQKPENADKALRVFVFGGGCAGLNYGMALGFIKPDDFVLETDGHKIVVDPKSMSFLNGMQVDYYETVQSSGFKFNNPNAVASCGCGLSFKTAQKTEMQKPKPCH
jgi:iron-sulfur cluster assembly accessory protein